MKFLEYTPLDSFSLFLSHLNLGESTIKGSLEAYSCKHTVCDKKLSLSLEHEILGYLGQSSDGDSPRKTLIYLVLTLSHMYPDHHFSAVQAHLFFNEEVWDTFRHIFETYLFEAAKEWALDNSGDSLFDSMSKAIDEVVRLDECEIYSYSPGFDGDPFLEKGAIWSFHFFFYNRKLKRVISFRCCCLSNLAEEGFLAGGASDDGDEDDAIFSNMDM
ncbi:unnamed protein product [Spirodela intermedia]|uniref:Repressor of RNA polymerase III transcription n=1 Tax=Spirodela intermedia TaxID=51605 RepID=A0A7I8IA30_SPIIN|nr:unnamed protein product [Spirodela intermedia]CAA6654535.1 unnamed protein product [Spirodela intermedia]